MSNKKAGSKFEREIQGYLNERGVCIRVGGSGTGKVNICDLVYIRGAKVFLIECKAIFGKKFYIYDREIDQFEELKKAAKSSGAKPVLILKFKRKKGRKRKIMFLDLEKFDFNPVGYDDYKDSTNFVKNKF